jgi:hypothetical protein
MGVAAPHSYTQSRNQINSVLQKTTLNCRKSPVCSRRNYFAHSAFSKETDTMKILFDITTRVLAGSVLLIGASTAFVAQAEAAGIVAGIEKAPVIADGNVRDQPADFVITLDGSLDQDVPGRSLAAGDVIKVIFPDDFDLSDINPAYPLLDVPTPFPPDDPLPANPCLPANLQCTTAVILHGWPQQPLFPPLMFHTLSIDPEENSLVFTAAQDIVPNPPENPGIKQLHLIMNGLTNPKPGWYQIRVEAQTGPSGAWETGSGILRIEPKTRPSINVTSVFVKATAGLLEGGPACGPGTNPPNPDNPIYQTTTVGSQAPFVWTFLLWGKNNEALDDVSLWWIDDNHAQLRRNAKVIGHVFIDAPLGAVGQDLELNPLDCPTLLGGAPVIAGTPGIGPQPVGRLDLLFRAGDKSGDYTTTFIMNRGGNTVQMVVSAE